MILRPQDIYTRRERDKRLAVFISEDALVENIKGLTESYLRKRARFDYRDSVKSRYLNQSVLPDTGCNWRYCERKGMFMYDYDRIPADRRKQLPKKEEILKLHAVCHNKADQHRIYKELKPYLANAVKYLPAYGTCTEVQAVNLARACAVIQYGADYWGSQADEWDKSFFKNLGELVASEGWTYLPKNYRRLKEKIDYVVNGVDVKEVIKLPRAGIVTRKPYDNAEVIGWIVHLRCAGQNYTGAYIARKVIQLAEMRGVQPPSFGWVEKFLAQPKIKFLTGGERHGKGKHGAQYRSYIPVEGALHAGDCWQMDGTRVNFIPHQSSDGKERSLIIIGVRDVHSGDLIGYHFDTKEDRWGYFHALEMAVKNAGHLPYELVHDRFPGHNTAEWELLTKRVNHLGVKTTVTSTATGKAHVERCFGTLQTVFMQDSPWYYGEGIQSSRENAHRSPEYLARAKKDARKVGFDFDMAWQSATEVVERYRDTKYSKYSRKNATIELSPKEMYAASKTPNVKDVDDFRRVEIFGTERPATIRNQGIVRTRIQKVDYVYRVPNYSVLKNYKEVALCYDLEDLSTVHLFAPGSDVNRAYLGEAVEERGAVLYGPDAEYDKLAKMKAARAKVEERRKQELEELAGPVADEMDLLLAAVAPKTTTDAAQDSWIAERMAVAKDTYGKPRLPEPMTVEAEDEKPYDDTLIIRNY